MRRRSGGPKAAVATGSARGVIGEQAKEGRLAEAPDQGEEARREAADVVARSTPVTDGERALLLAVVDDLFVRSRIDAAAAVAGVDVRYVGAADEVRAAVEERPARALLVGMAATRRRWPELIRQVRAEPVSRGLYVLAFGPHKNLALRAQALEAGADRVVANSAFIRLLPTVLATPTADVHDDEDA
jgi:PleD family two-component response regulator